MSMLWVICGAGRGVGKTTLALKLCETLPSSRYAKYGHGIVKADKPQTFFTRLPELESFLERSRDVYEHIVVESNALARLGRGDMIIFIDGIKGKTNFRKDSAELQTKAHLNICRRSIVREWQRDLFVRLRSDVLCRMICDCLTIQQQYLFGSSLAVRSKIWFETAGSHVFGVGLARLLGNVSSTGNLREGAKVSGMSYRYAWGLIRSAEDHIGKKLLERHAGGPHGGNSVLSTEGRLMLNIFEQLNTEVARYSDECFARLWKRRGF